MLNTTGSPAARISGLGVHRPSRVVGNDEIIGPIDSTDAWIRDRTGIASRRFAPADVEIVDMATDAVAKALADAGTDPSAVDLVLLATCSSRRPLPQAAPQVATRLGMSAAAALDVNAACSGFGYALALADAAVRTGTARTVAVVGVEKLSDWLDPTDRGTAMIFADGAGAAVVTGSDSSGIGPVAWGSDGSRAEAIRMPDGEQAVRMDGTAVYRWATTAVAPTAREALARAGVDPAELAVFVPHQANLRIVDSLVRNLDLGHCAVARDVVDAGNTSAASVPLALHRMRESGEARSGDLALLLAFGAGLTWAAQVVRVP